MIREAEFLALVRKADDATPSQRWVRELRALLEHAESFDPAVRFPVLDALCEIGVSSARARLHVPRDHVAQLAPRAMRSLESYLRARLRSATKPSLTLYLDAAQTAAETLGAAGTRSAASSDERALLLLRFFSAFPALARLWLVLISDWRSAVAEFLRRLANDRRAIERSFCNGRRAGEILDLRAGLSDPHRGGRAVIEVRFRSCSVIYKPRSGHGERAWFDCLSWMNSQGFTPQFRTLRIVDRGDHCWMEVATPATCGSKAALHSYYRRLGGMIAVAARCGAVDCHRDNLIAAGEHPFLVDAETLLQTHSAREEALPRVLRTGFLPLPAGVPGADVCASAVSREPGSHRPTLRGGPCDPADYGREMAEGFRLAESICGRRAFSRRLMEWEKFRWRRILRPTAIYADVCEGSVMPAALRSMRERSAIIMRRCRRPAVGASILRKEVEAIARLDVPYFTARMKVPPPDESDAGALLATLDQPSVCRYGV